MSNDPSKLSSSHGSFLSAYLEAGEAEELIKLLQVKNNLLLEHGGMSSKQVEMMQLPG
ncbi:hypothetical protein QYZ41_23265 [Vibrio parahaemolyticus]|nr:hypothetical protein [Vibrio parahaemolyticus]